MEQIKNAMEELKAIVESSDLENPEFNIDITYEFDTTHGGIGWKISGRIDVRKGWNDFISCCSDFDTTVQEAKVELSNSIQELLQGVA